MSAMNQILYPNVSRVPSNPGVGEGQRASGESPIQKGEFDQTLQRALDGRTTTAPMPQANPGMGAAVQGLKFSAHATQRLRERQIQFDSETLSKLNDAITKADGKGVQDSLVLTDKAALIVSVPSRTVITAMDRNQLTGNVFTNIDGAIIL